MTIHAPTTFADRTLLPRGLIKRQRTRSYRARWSFKLGQPVVLGGKVWIVIDRTRSLLGREVYSVYRHRDVRPLRVIVGSALVAAQVMLGGADLAQLFDVANALRVEYERDCLRDRRNAASAGQAGNNRRRIELAVEWSYLLARAHRRAHGRAPGVYTAVV